MAVALLHRIYFAAAAMVVMAQGGGLWPSSRAIPKAYFVFGASRVRFAVILTRSGALVARSAAASGHALDLTLITCVLYLYYVSYLY